MFYKCVIGICLLIIIIFIICYVKRSMEYISVEGSCGRKYYVLKRYNDTRNAADILCILNGRCRSLIDHLKSSNNDTEKVKILDSSYDWNDLIESADETYNLNKGRKIYLCMRDSSGNLFSINTLMFVVIHELAHIVTKTWDLGKAHSDEFWRNNIWLLKEAIKIGIYTPVDYSRKPIDYCNVAITSSPLYTFL